MTAIRKVRERLKYLTLPRAWNRVRTTVDGILRRTRARGYPTFLIVEPTNVCNLKCPLCPTGQRLSAPRGTMSMETFRRVIDQVHKYIRHLNLFYLGEPLLCDHIHLMIAYARRRKMKVTISSNLNLLDEALAERLIDSGLDYLIVSLDGTNQETYVKYRIGGDFQTVVDNIRLLERKKRERGSPYPRILLQFVVFKHNEHEVDAARDLARSLGVDVLLRQGALGGQEQSPPARKDRKLAEQWLTQKKEYQFEYDYFSAAPYMRRGPCGYLWNVLTVNWDGSVLPCCWTYDSRHGFGNLLHEDFKDIWNNARFQSSRGLFRRRGLPNANGNGAPRTICYDCSMYEQTARPAS